MRKIILLINFILVLALLTAFSRASMQQGHPSFNLSQTSYGPNQTIEGFVNISLTNEPSDTKIKSVLNPSSQNPVTKEMSILQFLQNSSAIFGCSQDCLPKYIQGIPLNSKILEFLNSEKEEKYLGVVAEGNSPQIKNFSFKLMGSSSGQEVCGNSPLKLDILDDGTYDFEYSIPSDDSWCSGLRSSSCFKKVYATSESDLSSSTPYCQKISLNSTAKLEVSANLKLVEEDESGENNVDFYIYSQAGILKGSCSTEHYFFEFTLANCTIGIDQDLEWDGFFIQEGDYYVCVKKSMNSGATYSIKKETLPEVCGFYGTPPSEPVEDYEIYVREALFKPFSEEQDFSADTLVLSSMTNYISTRYNGNCSFGCVIPLKFISLSQQSVSLDEITFKFQPLGTGESSNNYFYELVINQPKVNLSRQTIPFNLFNLTSPSQQGNNYRVSLFYGATSLGTAYFKVEEVPQILNLTPLNAIPNQATTFQVIATPSSGRQIMNYTWNFGDSSSEQTTQTPFITHAYSPGTFNLIVKATDSAGKTGSKTFTINTSVSKESLNQTYLYKKQALQNISRLQIEPWYKDIVYNSSYINETLFQVSLELNSSAPDLNSIKYKLDSVKVPVSIVNSLVLQESEYVLDKNSINLDVLEEIGAGTYVSGKEEETKNAILDWQKDVSMLLGTTIKKITFDDGSSTEITITTIKISQISEDTYVVYSLPSGTTEPETKIKESIELKDISDAIAFETSNDVILTIALPIKQDVSQIAFYASPSFSSLKLQGQPIINPPPSLLWPIILGSVVLLLTIILLIIIWRRKNSQDFGDFSAIQQTGMETGTGPFDNPNDLFNLVSYIQSSLAEGKKKKNIEQELLAQGWNKKQIDFAFKNKDNQNLNQGFNETQAETRNENSGLPPDNFDDLPDL